MSTFKELGLSEHIVATLSANGFEKPTPIQAQAIPLVLKDHDLIGLAQTGTGKTAAFGLPMIEKLVADGRRPDPRNIRALVLAPTRELVNQIAANLKLFVKKSPLKIGLVVGGVSINKQTEQLARGVDILVATPGRLLDLVSRKAVTLTQARYLVLDEADQMLDLGFIHDLRKISKLVPKNRQTLLFSATMPKLIAELAGEYLTDPVKVEVSPPGKAADKVEQYVHFVPGKDLKTTILKQTLTANPDGLSLIFSRTKHGAEKLMKHLDHVGFKAASIHGNKSQGQRERALKAFRDGEIRVLVATDVAARGIDIPGVTHVYNYDLPEVPDAYVHRIGRTARNGRDGIAIAFCAPDEIRLLRDIEKLMGIQIAVASGEAPADQARPSKGRGGRGNGQPRGNGQSRGNGAGQRQGGPRRDRPQRQAAAGGFAGDDLLRDERSHERRDQRAAGHGPADGRPEGHRNHKAQKHHGRPGPQQAGRRGSEQSGERNGGGNRPQRADGRGHQR
ncbi:DEAD/DEAH box helicase [Sinorhizobium meliloti]|uniref:DEAD/DEAH box helicase n=1 Tax=Rhizobium meliloti TaxID=382 RepID=UPI0001E4A55F|nr:DEAD/DEAH box helicase [Sinorhizobium meliloti]AEG07811.1 DEAD/DEAH box helicase domain protein [Sinorhizobium meliloti BL225C]ASP75365.1 ATP-dependent helicase [Sinorhizobium meliloti]MDE3859222.1 DEAD/DEAH box helicase [Sinorhizobium meliloti]MDE4548811.1 DEAD/DEAH box helicase [Sinorhizobium meliloti]MDE4570609.1 DEAD/DEAH box helicase [Sinorhizobium meliloti]